MGDEADALNDLFSDYDVAENILRNTIDQYQRQYDRNKQAPIKATCTCPVCRCYFIKKTKQQAFHSIKCKDRYWNTVDDSRRHRAARF